MEDNTSQGMTSSPHVPPAACQLAGAFSHDDQVDAIAGACLLLRELNTSGQRPVWLQALIAAAIGVAGAFAVLWLLDLFFKAVAHP